MSSAGFWSRHAPASSSFNLCTFLRAQTSVVERKPLLTIRNLSTTTTNVTNISVPLRQPEQQTLEQLYEPKIQSKSATAPGTLAPKIAAFMKELNTRRKGFRDTANAVQGSALQEVEQEREVAFEVEAVREVQKPVHYSPLYFSGLHSDITHFAQTGRLVAGSGGYEQAFVSLRRTALGHKYGIRGEATSSKLYVSMEFTRTVSMPLGRPNDDFQRQVNWILWSPVAEAALIINPEEAELIIRFLFGSKMPPTYLLTYAAPVTRNMLHFNALHYYAIPELPRGWRAPSWLMIELGIFAGRLYFEYEEYGDLRTFLGLHEVVTNDTAELDGTEGLVIDDAADGLEIHPRAARQTQSFTTKPLTFLQEWLAVRRKGQDFAHTPMGYVCQGKPLSENHPFFVRVESNGGRETDRGNGQRREGKVCGYGTNDESVSDEERADDGYGDCLEDGGGMVDESGM